MRAALARAGAIAAAVLPAVAGAAGPGQTATGPADMPPGWRHSADQGIDTYLKGADRADAVVLMRELPTSTVEEGDSVTARLFSTMGCRGVPPPSREGIVGPFGDGTRCFASFARSPGGHRIAVDAAATPQAEAEGMTLAKRLPAAGQAATDASAPAAPGVGVAENVRVVDAALAAALDAVPKRNLPVHMTLRRGLRYTGTNVEMDYRLWMLFADGFATSCTEWDPAVQSPTAESLASLLEKTSCSATRWRPVAGRAVFDDQPEDDPVSLEDGPPPVRGTTFAGYFKSSEVLFSNLDGLPGPKQLLIDSTAMSLAHDGRFRLGTERFELSGPGPNRTGDSLTGRYMIDRYLIAIAVNGKVERHFFFALGKPTDKDLLIYFDSSLLSNH